MCAIVKYFVSLCVFCVVSIVAYQAVCFALCSLCCFLTIAFVTWIYNAFDLSLSVLFALLTAFLVVDLSACSQLHGCIAFWNCLPGL